MLLFIYLLGFVAAYYLGRYIVRIGVRKGTEKYTWNTVCLLFALALLSWVAAIAYSLLILLTLGRNSEPPKWL